MMFFRVNVFAFAALYLLVVKGQSNHIVNVALQGSVFDPQITGAQVNDTVTFQFIGDIHTVTQSSFENPCSPLSGGFNSGPGGKGTNASAPVETWTLLITNVSAPIWFFCTITKPISHCNQGMVGVINPPSPDMFNQFQVAAKLDTGTPVPTVTAELTGQGAFASLLPTAPPVPVTPPTSSLTSTSTVSKSTSATSTSSSSTLTPTQTAAASSTNPHLGAIVGGSVAGGFALIGLVVVLWSCCLRKRKPPKAHEVDDFFRYNPVPIRRPSEVFTESRRAEITHNNSVTSNTMTNYSGSRAPEFSPVRPQFGQSGPRILEPPNLRRQPSAQSDLVSSNLAPSTSGHTHSEQANKFDVRALAQEIAAVLYQGPPANGHQKDSSSQDLRGQMAISNHEDATSTISRQTQPPPNYHAATGPSPTHRGNT